jgi:beta-phosphoglucomutase
MKSDIKAVIFDLDGVIVSTDEFHYQAWKRLADEERIPFDRRINQRLRGVSRMASLDILLEKARRRYSEGEKTEMADRKNAIYRRLLDRLTPDDILPGFAALFSELKASGIKAAVASSSRNAFAESGPGAMPGRGRRRSGCRGCAGRRHVRAGGGPCVFRSPVHVSRR